MATKVMDTENMKMTSDGFMDPIWLTKHIYGSFTDVYGIGLTMLMLLSECRDPYETLEQVNNLINSKNGKKLNSYLIGNWNEHVINL